MAKYRVLEKSYINDQIFEAGAEVVYSGIPGMALEPLDADAKKAVAERDAKKAEAVKEADKAAAKEAKSEAKAEKKAEKKAAKKTKTDKKPPAPTE